MVHIADICFRDTIRGLKLQKRMSENFKDAVVERYLDCVANKRIFKAVVSLAKHCGANNPRDLKPKAQMRLSDNPMHRRARGTQRLEDCYDNIRP